MSSTPWTTIRKVIDCWTSEACGIKPVWAGETCEKWNCGTMLEAFVASVSVRGNDSISWCYDATVDPDRSMVPYVVGRRDVLISLRANSTDAFVGKGPKPWELLEAIQASAVSWKVQSVLRANCLTFRGPQGEVRRADFRQGEEINYRASLELVLGYLFTLKGCGEPTIDGVKVTSQIALPDGSFPAVNITSEQIPA